ncbi:MAG TPA: TIGR01777 family oxidoreductase [Anaerolineae bacterium]|nr:TIGR01777 family oxidoreductase [Anaerolineae bacterium]
MRVIITGGTGQIGRDLAASLAADGHEVIVLTRSPESATGLAAGVRPVGWDARTAEGWGHLADRAGAIVNLAGANLAGEGFFPSRWTEARKQIIRDSRVNAGKAVVEAVLQAEARPRVVIQASGVGYYGARKDYPVTVDSPPGDDFTARLAADDWEPSTAPVEEMGVRRVIIRSGAVLNAREGALLRMLLPFRLFVGGPMGSGKQWFSWIHQQDEVRAIRFLIEQEEARGPYNLTAPQPVSNKEFARALGRALRRPSWFPLPAFALRLAFGEVSDVLLKGQAATPDRLQALGFEFKYPDVDSALRDLVG